MMALRAHRRGGPDVLVYETAPMPPLAAGEVIVEVHAAGVTFAELSWDDTWTRNGHDRTPIIPTHEFSGVVVDAAGDVSRFKSGDEVFGMIPFDQDGAAAQFARVPVTGIVTKPAGLSHRDAAVVPISGLTAWQALVTHARIESGEKVLILGGTGAVGTFLIQIARQLGARVAATVRRDDEGVLASLGADEVFNTRDGAQSLPAGAFDVAIEASGAGVDAQTLDAVRPGGRLITLAGPAPASLLEGRSISSTFFIVTPDLEVLEGLGTQVRDGSLRALVSDTYPLDRGQEAFVSAGSPNRTFGKTVIAVR